MKKRSIVFFFTVSLSCSCSSQSSFLSFIFLPLFNACTFTFIHTKYMIWTVSSEFGTYSLCEQRRFRRACASAQSRQNLRCSLIQAVSQEEHSDRKPDPWPLWMAGHAQLKFVMTECSKTQIRLTRLIYKHSRSSMQKSAITCIASMKQKLLE